MKPYLSINDAGQFICEIGDEKIVVRSIEQLVELIPDGALCSSSVDFPEEYSSDPAVLALCADLQALRAVS